MSTSVTVVFSKLHLIGGALAPGVISRKCFCTPGTKPQKMTYGGCEEIPHALFGETIKSFVEQWDTRHLHPIAAEREVALWGSFFTCPRYHWTAKNMIIQRDANDQFVFEAEVIEGGNQVSTLFEASFGVEACEQDKTTLSSILEKETEEAQASGLRIKNKVLIYVESRLTQNRFSPPTLLKYNTKEPLTFFLEKNRLALSVYSINPIAVNQFSLAPSVHRMTQTSGSKGLPIVQHFSESSS